MAFAGSSAQAMIAAHWRGWLKPLSSKTNAPPTTSSQRGQPSLSVSRISTAQTHGNVKPLVLRCLRSSITIPSQPSRARPPTTPRATSRVSRRGRAEPLLFATRPWVRELDLATTQPALPGCQAPGPLIGCCPGRGLDLGSAAGRLARWGQPGPAGSP